MMALLNLAPRWLLALGLAAALGLGAVQTVKLSSARSDTLKAQEMALDAREQISNLHAAIAEANARAAEQATRLQTKVIEAQNDARARETVLRAAAAAAANESDGLRLDLEAARGQLGELSAQARAERAVAVESVLIQCSREYQSLAGKADRHANDLRTLIDAWPR